MPRILIAGCGYVGEAAADLFHAAGWAVEAWTRSTESAASLAAKPYPVRGVDISKCAEVAQSALAAAGVDAVIHCASSRGGDAGIYRQLYLNGARNLLDTFPKSKTLFTSSTSVYTQRDGARSEERRVGKECRSRGRR